MLLPMKLLVNDQLLLLPVLNHRIYFVLFF